jgi:hypothetical protein
MKNQNNASEWKRIEEVLRLIKNLEARDDVNVSRVKNGVAGTRLRKAESVLLTAYHALWLKNARVMANIARQREQATSKNRQCWAVRFNNFCCDTGHHTRWYFFQTQDDALRFLDSWRKDIEVGNIWGDGPEMMFEPVFRSEVRCEECDYPLEWTKQTYDSDPKPRLVCKQCAHHEERDEAKLYGNDDDTGYIPGAN